MSETPQNTIANPKIVRKFLLESREKNYFPKDWH